jgi:hypothetical protein
MTDDITPEEESRLIHHLREAMPELSPFSLEEEGDAYEEDASRTIDRGSRTIKPPLNRSNSEWRAAAAQAWDMAVGQVAELFVSGATLTQIAERTGLTNHLILQALFEARPTIFIQEGSMQNGILKQSDALLEPLEPRERFVALLRRRSQVLRRVTVFPAIGPAVKPDGTLKSSDEQIEQFGLMTGPYLMELLSGANYMGVGWGRMVASGIAGMRATYDIDPPSRHARGPLECIATVGGFVGTETYTESSSSSALAMKLSRTVNGTTEHARLLAGVEGFICSCLDRPDEVELIRKRTKLFPNYQAIFGGPGRAGKIAELDGIITSCGTAHHYNDFWSKEFYRCGITLKRLNSLTYGNIGGAPIEREDLGPEDRVEFENVILRWTGITTSHFVQIAERTPGVIMLALTHNNPRVVLKCVELDMVSELVIDANLAVALWSRLNPGEKVPATEELVSAGTTAPALAKGQGELASHTRGSSER